MREKLTLAINCFKTFKARLREFFHIVCYVKSEDIRSAWTARRDRTSFNVRLKDGKTCYEINHLMDLLSLKKRRVEGDIYLWEYKKKKVYGNLSQMQGLMGEYFKGLYEDYYSYDWKNKKVVDIGGYVGDTALYFFSKGADRVVIYEPVSKNIQALKYNLKGYEGQIEYFQEALAADDRPVRLSSDEPPCSCGFGLKGGKYSVECSGVAMSTILQRHPPIDIMKIDCEGGEVHLLDVADNDLKSVPYWIIETHSKEIYHRMVNKFIEAGFLKVAERSLNLDIDLLHFSRHPV